MVSAAKLLPALLFSLPVWAASPAQIEYAVQHVLAREGALFVSYTVYDSGRVGLMFGVNEPDWRIEKTVKALQSHPDIPSVTWIKTDTDFCPIR